MLTVNLSLHRNQEYLIEFWLDIILRESSLDNDEQSVVSFRTIHFDLSPAIVSVIMLNVLVAASESDSTQQTIIFSKVRSHLRQPLILLERTLGFFRETLAHIKSWL